MASFTVIYDACLFYPAPLRDLMIRLAQTRRFHARWTEEIQREWLAALLRNRPELDEAKLQRTTTLINQAVPDCLVTGYGHLIDRLSLPDPNDRHVLAAAIRSGAQVIVTTNLKDFPQVALADFDIDARHPDDFILDLADLDPAIVTTSAKLQRAALKHPPLLAETFIDTLRRQGLPGVAGFLQGQIALI
ncbi:PIN domain-containing protein [Thiorhodococcus minor]|uniref:PIN domain-containing protein n=1 Tax=Thiorhodococcus minor TaxID=57489 RepID=A0A6M0K0B7_9GAMM|nr:PIN domain-containing protein [Thiorhodococcus minor]